MTRELSFEELEMHRETVASMTKAVILAVCLGMAGVAHAGFEQAVSGYNFAYTPKGDRSVWPTQVFDDGVETFFQFNPEKTIPALFALSSCGDRILLTPGQRGPYLVVPALYKSYVLQLGSKSSTVVYSGARAMAPAHSDDSECQKKPVGPAYGPASVQSQYGVAKPIRGDDAVPIQAEGGGDPAARKPRPSPDEATASLKKDAERRPVAATSETRKKAQTGAVASVEPASPVTNSAAASSEAPVGIVNDRAAPVPQAASTSPIQTWQILASDMRLDKSFERWAEKAGYKVQWDADKHVLIEATPTFTGTFEEAITQALMTPGIRLSAYPLEACVYENSPPLVRITRQGEQARECTAQQ
jgi:hypothetical protein